MFGVYQASCLCLPTSRQGVTPSYRAQIPFSAFKPQNPSGSRVTLPINLAIGTRDVQQYQSSLSVSLPSLTATMLPLRTRIMLIADTHNSGFVPKTRLKTAKEESPSSASMRTRRRSTCARPRPLMGLTRMDSYSIGYFHREHLRMKSSNMVFKSTYIEWPHPPQVLTVRGTVL